MGESCLVETYVLEWCVAWRINCRGLLDLNTFKKFFLNDGIWCGAISSHD